MIEDYGEGREFVSSVETFCGHFLDYLNPQPDQIELEDIARGLSQVCRFAGQTTRWYSVAEHAVYVRSLVIEAGHPELGFAALHHDSHEAYLGDLPSPLKLVLDSELLRRLSHSIDVALCWRFGLESDSLKHPIVKEMDTLAMRREAATLKYSHGVGPHWGFSTPTLSLAGIGWSPDRAEREFIKAHLEECSS